jgi:hypothetical protein
MTNLGPASTPRLEPLRPGDRDPRRHEQPPSPPKGARAKAPQPDQELTEELAKDAETHQLDEQA